MKAYISIYSVGAYLQVSKSVYTLDTAVKCLYSEVVFTQVTEIINHKVIREGC